MLDAGGYQDRKILAAIFARALARDVDAPDIGAPSLVLRHIVFASGEMEKFLIGQPLNHDSFHLDRLRWNAIPLGIDPYNIFAIKVRDHGVDWFLPDEH